MHSHGKGEIGKAVGTNKVSKYLTGCFKHSHGKGETGKGQMGRRETGNEKRRNGDRRDRNGNLAYVPSQTPS